MTPKAFEEMMRRATPDCRAVNANNHDLHPKIEIEPGKWKLQSAIAREVLGQAELGAIKTAANLGIRPSTDESKLNKTERSYLAWLRAQQPLWYGIQCLTLKLADDCRFTPDFVVLDATGFRLIDTKAKWGKKVHIEDDAMVKIKVAARLFPMWSFVLAWKDGDIWQHKIINR